ncbi:TIGR02391 family protein [Allomuricauda taeanensis]|uniref:TIGR02391 family protein n=1 Tax=Flagellimonas taeanensis TaxID=1005926 RepID=UPI002E7C1730|nr:TIGR02391 family protein [Allomuricauda taeanensis]MEE1961419.1 TIGR02391 family protein [Allomuricauda taeanensis]
MSKAEIQAKIEFQDTIGEANEGGFQPIRFTRVKYKQSPTAHIDIRKFQRGYDDDGEEVFFPTKLGFRFPESEFKKVLEKYSLLPTTYVHPKIIEKSFKLSNNKEYESAVLQAFKIIETTIREKISAEPEEVGIKLIRKAFHPENGPLTDFKLPKSEREAFANYIAGAFGYYKNPCSHRDVELDFIEAFERIVVASDLLKKIELECPF